MLWTEAEAHNCIYIPGLKGPNEMPAHWCINYTKQSIQKIDTFDWMLQGTCHSGVFPLLCYPLFFNFFFYFSQSAQILVSHQNPLTRLGLWSLCLIFRPAYVINSLRIFCDWSIEMNFYFCHHSSTLDVYRNSCCGYFTFFQVTLCSWMRSASFINSWGNYVSHRQSFVSMCSKIKTRRCTAEFERSLWTILCNCFSLSCSCLPITSDQLSN